MARGERRASVHGTTHSHRGKAPNARHFVFCFTPPHRLHGLMLFLVAAVCVASAAQQAPASPSSSLLEQAPAARPASAAPSLLLDQAPAAQQAAPSSLLVQAPAALNKLKMLEKAPAA